MSIIHVNQIKSHVTRIFDDLIDLSDVEGASADVREDFFLSRALAAYAVHFLSGATPQEAAQAVTDGGDDNGLDAVYYDEPNKRLYLVQSKWIKDGTGEPSNGEVKKFMAGVHDLFNMQFDRFNAKVASKKAQVVQALNDPATRYEVVLAYTGASRLAPPSQRDCDDLTREMNDTSEVVFVNALNQSDLHNSLAASVAGEPITLDIGLKSWGKKEAPHEAFYGQLSGDQIGTWWTKYRTRLFAKNLRSALGDTEVNTEMRQALEQRTAEFWYFNNGVTIVAKKAQRTMAGGASHDFATFHCDDISVVNGAQTVGTIGKFAESNPGAAPEVYVPVRIIVRGDDEAFGQDVTRTNNRQNRIENRDFVSLDPEQGRLRKELAIDGIEYQVARSETSSRSDASLDLVEATTALACASGKVRLVVQLKREVGKLWEDLTKAPYKELFNASVAGQQVWRAVQIQRRIDKALETRHKRGGSYAGKNYAVATHGNRMIAALVFEALPVAKVWDTTLNIEDFASDEVITKLVDSRLDYLVSCVDTHYANSIIPTLFKNQKKCEHLHTESKAAIANAALTSAAS